MGLFKPYSEHGVEMGNHCTLQVPSGYQSSSHPHSYLKSFLNPAGPEISEPIGRFKPWDPAQQVQVMSISVSKSLLESHCQGVPKGSRVTDSSWPRVQAFSSSQLSGECWIYRQ